MGCAVLLFTRLKKRRFGFIESSNFLSYLSIMRIAC
ncbi:hypothetical protein VAA_04311 [Vibrio anguillarum 775]|nr:hypothetical protein VAA_04311 [Vibrio anguillarum 775]